MDNQTKNRPEDDLLYTKVVDRLFLCAETGRNTFTDFMDPVRARRYASILERSYGGMVQIDVSGGLVGNERLMLGFTPVGSELSTEDFPIVALEINFNEKFARLTHRDFLGALCGMGIDRSRMGDIVVEKGRAIAFVHEDISGYIQSNLDKVGSSGVSVSEVNPAKRILDAGEKKEARVIVASMRLDCIVGAAFRLSRAKSAAAITGEKVLANWEVITEPSKMVKDGDVITLRGSGRLRIDGIDGKTKKGRTVVRITI